MQKAKVENMQGHSGRGVVNQFIITTHEGQYFQSYNSVIAFVPFDQNEPTLLDREKWDYSTTTGKYRNLFLCDASKQETQNKIDAGVYKLVDLN